MEIATPDGPQTIPGVTVSVGYAVRTRQTDLTSLLEMIAVSVPAAEA